MLGPSTTMTTDEFSKAHLFHTIDDIRSLNCSGRYYSIFSKRIPTQVFLFPHSVSFSFCTLELLHLRSSPIVSLREGFGDTSASRCSGPSRRRSALGLRLSGPLRPEVPVRRDRLVTDPSSRTFVNTNTSAV